MARNASKKKSSNPRVNFEGVETISVIPEGEYIASVSSVKMEESQSGNDYLAWELIISSGKNKGKKLFHNTSLAEQSLWATKKFLENLGVEVEDGEMELELGEYVDMEIGVIVEHETYKGRARSRIVDTYPAEDEGSEKGDKEDEDGGGDTYTEEAVNEMGKKELKEIVEKHELDVELEGSTSSQRRAVIKALKAEDLIGDGEEKKPAKGKKSKVEDEEDDEKPAKGRKGKKDEDEEEKPARGRRGRKAKDEEEEEKPAKGKKGKKSKTYSADDVNSMDEEALGEVIETHELDVDLDDHSTMKRKRSAVIDALEGAELLED